MTQYVKTLFIPDFAGQYKIWENNIAKTCNTVNKVIQLGNFINILPEFKDTKKEPGPNGKLSKFLQLYRITSKDSWVQLIGKNELLALNFPDKWTNSKTHKILRDLWFPTDPSMKIATVDKNRLVTHAGLTHGEWINLGKPKTATEAANRINEKYEKKVFFKECFLLNNKPNYAADPVFADSAMELYPSWITTTDECPFSQIIGSESLERLESRELLNETRNPLSFIDNINFTRYGSITKIQKSTITALDLRLPNSLGTQLPGDKSLYIEKTIV